MHQNFQPFVQIELFAEIEPQFFKIAPHCGSSDPFSTNEHLRMVCRNRLASQKATAD
jgi:hypothetical protein